LTKTFVLLEEKEWFSSPLSSFHYFWMKMRLLIFQIVYLI